jgi:hypothetical protein
MYEYDPESPMTVREVFEHADALMYQRKQALRELGAHAR